MLEIRKDFCAFCLVLQQNYHKFKVHGSFYRDIFRIKRNSKIPVILAYTGIFYDVLAKKSR